MATRHYFKLPGKSRVVVVVGGVVGGVVGMVVGGGRPVVGGAVRILRWL